MLGSRSHTCGGLKIEDVGSVVELCGWVSKRRDHGGVIFIDLRDRYGVTQIVFHLESSQVHQNASRLRNECVVACRGTVQKRPVGMENVELSTGEIEVLSTELTILSEAKNLPFAIDDNTEVAESVRLKYRYLDLRRPSLQKNLMIRHRMLSIVRNHLDSHSFVEIETPILYKSTPEGARDFVVPSRLNKGAFYALPQSPQILKQLLMVGGMDRYYQIARCFRDEDLRSDRQPEFSQVDIEMSFIQEDVFFPIIESMFIELWKTILNQDLPKNFPKMTYSEAMNRFGSDKPDTRFGLELMDFSDVFESSAFQVFQSALKKEITGIRKGSVRGLVLPEQAEHFSRKDLEDLQASLIDFGAKGLLWIKVLPDGELQSPAAKFFSDSEKEHLKKKANLKPGTLVLVVADARNKIVYDSLGALRLQLASRLKIIPEGKSHFLWVTHFPLLEYDEKEKRYYACHHPFTSPQSDYFEALLEGKDLEQIPAAAYDLVLNGVEVGGGSFRIYRPEIQSAMFKALGLSQKEASEKFGFFLEALQYGTPPHGGIALGVDRIAALLCGVGPIREVIAFPKTQKGTCLMSDAPSEISVSQLDELGISHKLIQKHTHGLAVEQVKGNVKK